MGVDDQLPAYSPNYPPAYPGAPSGFDVPLDDGDQYTTEPVQSGFSLRDFSPLLPENRYAWISLVFVVVLTGVLMVLQFFADFLSPIVMLLPFPIAFLWLFLVAFFKNDSPPKWQDLCMMFSLNYVGKFILDLILGIIFGIALVILIVVLFMLIFFVIIGASSSSSDPDTAAGVTIIALIIGVIVFVLALLALFVVAYFIVTIIEVLLNVFLLSRMKVFNDADASFKRLNVVYQGFAGGLGQGTLTAVIILGARSSHSINMMMLQDFEVQYLLDMLLSIYEEVLLIPTIGGIAGMALGFSYASRAYPLSGENSSNIVRVILPAVLLLVGYTFVSAMTPIAIGIFIGLFSTMSGSSATDSDTTALFLRTTLPDAFKSVTSYVDIQPLVDYVTNLVGSTEVSSSVESVTRLDGQWWWQGGSWWGGGWWDNWYNTYETYEVDYTAALGTITWWDVLVRSITLVIATLFVAFFAVIYLGRLKKAKEDASWMGGSSSSAPDVGTSTEMQVANSFGINTSSQYEPGDAYM